MTPFALMFTTFTVEIAIHPTLIRSGVAVGWEIQPCGWEHSTRKCHFSSVESSLARWISESAATRLIGRIL
jgi:hypothetical protein